MRTSILLATLLSVFPPTASPAVDVAIVGATVVDVSHGGRSTHDRVDATVLIHDGLIAKIGERRRVPLPKGTRVIDATGQYAVPGLIDGFGALRTQGFADAYLFEGVTSVMVIESPPGADGEQTIAAVRRGPRLLRGATLSGRPVPTAEIDRLATSGVRSLLLDPFVRPQQLDSRVAAARRRHLATLGEPAFTTYPRAIAAGLGALLRLDRYLTALSPPEARLSYARDPTGPGAIAAVRGVCAVDPTSPAVADFGRRLARSRTALMPILAIEATADDVGAPNPWLSRSAVFVQPADLDDPVDPKTGARPYLESHPDRRQALRDCAVHRQQLDGRLHQLGARHLAGSGAPAFGILPGGGLHQELKLLVRIGLTPREALAAATGNFAEAFGWLDIGKLEEGRAGDVLLLGSDPRRDVLAIDDIAGVVHDGEVVDRQGLLSAAKGPGAR